MLDGLVSNVDAPSLIPAGMEEANGGGGGNEACSGASPALREFFRFPLREIIFSIPLLGLSRSRAYIFSRSGIESTQQKRRDVEKPSRVMEDKKSDDDVERRRRENNNERRL